MNISATSALAKAQVGLFSSQQSKFKDMDDLSNIAHSLMPYRVRKILLVSSPYDQFTLEEDGHIEAQIHSEYAEQSLSSPPTITRVASASEGVEVVGCDQTFDLIICTFNVGDISPFEFAALAKERSPNTAFVLLTSFSREIMRRIEAQSTHHIDYIFAWQGNAELLLAIIKMLEDKHNAANDMALCGVQAILLVEDSIRFYSAYLPDLYKIVFDQTERTAAEALNEQQRLLRKKARPKILFARDFAAAIELYNTYKENLMGVISDVSFACSATDGTIIERAGIELCTTIREQDSKIPILLQSSQSSMRIEAQSLGAEFLDKSSPTLFACMSDFIHTRLAFGQFSFVDPMSGEVVAQAGDLRGMQQALKSISDEILLFYATQNMFSKWFYARGMFEVARALKAKIVANFESPSSMRTFMVDIIGEYRRAIGRGVIAQIKADTYGRHIAFSRSGLGSLGGKARGLAFVGNLIEKYGLYNKWDGVKLVIPRTLALTTDYFEQFIAVNGLNYVCAGDMGDKDILSDFLSARLPDRLVADLRIFLEHIPGPLAVRSSSKLEDSHYQPFAGVYSTYMVPRAGNAERDLRLVSRAIKSVYASVFFASSRAYIASTGNLTSEEAMGVVIQQLCGSEQDGLFMPTFSGVAQSINFYPIGDEKATDGVCSVAFGLGKTVVDNGDSMRFSPAHPRHALQLTSQDIMRRQAQKYFYALDLNPQSFKSSTDDSSNLKKISIGDGVKFANMRHVASTWDMASERVVDSFNEPGFKLITFANILKYDTFPLAAIIEELLAIGERELQSPVEIEFAVDMDVLDGAAAKFNFLQIRPIVSQVRTQAIDWSEVDHSAAIIYAQKALGNGNIDGVCDILYVRGENFDASKSRDIAAEIEAINEQFKASCGGYVLVGPGRWGSSDSWLGIPVTWSQISQSRVIVECGMESFQVDPSQGTHFFQNLTSFGVGYLTVNPFLGDGHFDVSRLDAMDATYESDYLRLVHFEHPLHILLDAKNSRAVVNN